MSTDLDCLIAGGGVVGQACARALAQAGLSVALCEREIQFGQGISSRSSEVIHAGLHYAPGSMKARLCVEGARRLYAYCTDRGIAHRRLGKLVVALRDEEIPRLVAMRDRAQRNGVPGCRLLDHREVRRLEPRLECVAALSSPATGILDSHGLIEALGSDADEAGAMRVVNTPVLGAKREGDGWEIRLGGTEPIFVRSRWLINAAGLGAQTLARHISGFPREAIPARHLAKGCYFALSGPQPFRHLIYPVPEPGGLGIHLTLDLAGQARFGPDVQWISRANYAVSKARVARFAEAIRRYWPGLDERALTPAFAGIRPKIVGPGDADADFRIDGPDDHGLPGLIQMFGIESPGLTASLAIAAHVTERIAN